MKLTIIPLLFFSLLFSTKTGLTTEMNDETSEGTKFSLLDAINGNASLTTIRSLITNKADVNEKGQNDHTPLIQASLHGQVEVVNLLLQHGANPNPNKCAITPHCRIIFCEILTEAEKRKIPDGIIALLKEQQEKSSSKIELKIKQTVQPDERKTE